MGRDWPGGVCVWGVWGRVGWGGIGGGGGLLTVSHRLQLQRLGCGRPQALHGGLPHLGLEKGVHHCGLAQPALAWG